MANPVTDAKMTGTGRVLMRFVRILNANRFHVPGWIRKIALRRLFTVTAAAFACAAPNLNRLTAQDMLFRFAQLTREQALLAITSSEGPDAAMERLYQHSRRLGDRLHRQLRLSSDRDVIVASQLLYGMLGIDMRHSGQGKITISRCFFSTIYTPDVCRVISALDSGLACGLSGGKNLVFSQRITDGRSCCEAMLQEVNQP